ncbi:type 2 phosphatidylinositol 4,5-bisphosphate 4-phosphatase-like isoform X2 [Dermacentor silvarum]|uniref:type 2 phosphatidylinositol 4,5-bisphosphate 4-phosphatase-like isoform X2 n=1 Tax=Dermacentor silvarum TaxID=543639 RepID=UPI002100C7DA|nr:type 2 phosphatidylinositol 4,5-bisphosphate 4-phosphatase-like isoform X2 [Dermacentor silvarum]
MAYAEVAPLLRNASSGNYSSMYPSAPARESPPPSYDDVSFIPSRVKACDVCSYQIDILKHVNDYVVPCPRCNEFTALGNPPKGKRYIRCGCNKLLQCVKSATSITCSRPGCGAVIKPEGYPAAKAKTQRPGNRTGEELTEPHAEPSYRFVCGHCQSVSVISTMMLKHNSGYWWAYLLGLALAVLFIFYGLWLLCLKKSTVEVR